MGQNDFKRALERENQSFDEHLNQENENLVINLMISVRPDFQTN
jgi:hypothetical protein